MFAALLRSFSQFATLILAALAAVASAAEVAVPVRTYSLHELVPLLTRIRNRPASPQIQTVSATGTELKISSAATKRAIPPAPMGMSSGATAAPARLATMASRRLVSNVAGSRAKHRESGPDTSNVDS